MLSWGLEPCPHVVKELRGELSPGMRHSTCVSEELPPAPEKWLGSICTGRARDVQRLPSEERISAWLAEKHLPGV